jgi:uncharacterized protein (DUF934 family)
MPRLLLRDGSIVADDWTRLGDADASNGGPHAGAGLILTFEQWLGDKQRWRGTTGRLGVALLPADKVETLAPDLECFALVAADFPGPSDGRGYTQGRLLRERFGFRGELRAAGYVRLDQIFFLARCGFNSFELPPGDLEGASAAMRTFSAEYQPSNDAGLTRRLRHR